MTLVFSRICDDHMNYNFTLKQLKIKELKQVFKSGI